MFSEKDNITTKSPGMEYSEWASPSGVIKMQNPVKNDWLPSKEGLCQNVAGSKFSDSKSFHCGIFLLSFVCWISAHVRDVLNVECTFCSTCLRS